MNTNQPTGINPSAVVASLKKAAADLLAKQPQIETNLLQVVSTNRQTDQPVAVSNQQINASVAAADFLNATANLVLVAANRPQEGVYAQQAIRNVT